MAQDRFNDGPDVVIRPGSPPPSSGGGFFSIGGGGGFGGGFGGSSRRRAKKRARARAAALAQARAQEQARRAAAAQAQAEARALAHRQQVATFAQAREARRAQLDQHYLARAQQLPEALKAQVLAARTRPGHQNGERWELYQISKARSETEGLVASKRSELARQQASAAAFAGADMAGEAYAARLAGLAGAAQMQQLHSAWEAGYVAAHEARLLEESIRQLAQRSADLLDEHARQTLVLQARDASWQRRKQYAEQRQARVRFKQQADEERRLLRLEQAATLAAPVAAAQAGGVLLGQAGAQVAAEVAAAIEQAARELLRVAAIRSGQAVSLFATALLYAPPLGDGELTEAQRARHLDGLGVRADLLGIEAGQDLQVLADAGGSARLASRIKLEHLPGGTGVALATTGAGIAAQVPVRNAVHDPLTDTWRLAADKPGGKTLVFGGPLPAAASPATGRMLALSPQVADVAAGADLRLDDCIVCIPGQAPQYFSFAVAPAGTGVVTGKGQDAAGQWWSASAAPAGLALPTQVGNQLRGRVFTALPAFEGAVWRAIAAEPALLGQFDRVNQQRLLNGYAPVAPRTSWKAALSQFELRHTAAGTDSSLYDLDQLRIHKPADVQGVRRVIPAYEPWFAAGVAQVLHAALAPGQPSSTWTPLAVPGAELLGPTGLPEAPPIPGVLPGAGTDPVESGSEILPGQSPGETGAIIPGFGDGTELPAPGLVNNEPAKPLEVGEYKDLSRRSINDRMDVDHIVSRKAYQRYLIVNSSLDPREIKAELESAPSIVIPSEVHRKFSETYGGRNSKARQISDAADLGKAVDRNLDALKPGLLEYGFSEDEIEGARQQLHALHRQKGLYE